VGDAGIDGRRDPGLDHEADVDSGRHAGEVERRNGPGRIGADRDLRHRSGERQGLRRASRPHIGDDGRRRRHGEAAEAHGLHDGRVAHVGIRIPLAEAGKIDALRHLHRGGEPAVAGAGDADAEIGAVAAHRRDDGTGLDVARRIGQRLAGRHGDVEEELIVAADELQARGELVVARCRAGERGRQLAQQQARAGDVALMHLVAHGQAAGDEGLERDAARVAQRAPERRAERLADPAQAVEHLGIIAAEPHDLAEAFVDRTIGAVPERPVLDHHERLALRGESGHRTDRAEMVIGVEREGPGGGLVSRFVEVAGPALEHRNAHDGATHGTAHPLPADRRSGVEDRAVGEIRNRLCGGHDVDQDRLAGEQAAQRFLIGLLDLLHAAVPGSIVRTRG
jgi:hypothetical protein